MKITEEQAKAMCYQDAMNDFFFFFLLFFFCVFWSPYTLQSRPNPLALLLFICIFQPLLQLIPLGNVCQIKPAPTTILLYLCPTADVFRHFSHLGFSLTVGSIVQETVPAPKLDPFYHLFHLGGVTKCCPIYIKTVYKKKML